MNTNFRQESATQGQAARGAWPREAAWPVPGVHQWWLSVVSVLCLGQGACGCVDSNGLPFVSCKWFEFAFVRSFDIAADCEHEPCSHPLAPSNHNQDRHSATPVFPLFASSRAFLCVQCPHKNTINLFLCNNDISDDPHSTLGGHPKCICKQNTSFFQFFPGTSPPPPCLETQAFLFIFGGGLNFEHPTTCHVNLYHGQWDPGPGIPGFFVTRA